jgi:hypothetical protein
MYVADDDDDADATGLAKVWLHTQDPPGFGPWGFKSPPGTMVFLCVFEDLRIPRVHRSWLLLNAVHCSKDI